MKSNNNNSDLLVAAARVLIQGNTSEEAAQIKKSAEVNLGDPLRKIVLFHLGEMTELPCPTKKEIAEKVVNDFYDEMNM